MKNIPKRIWWVVALTFVSIAMVLWARELASWRPQKLGVFPASTLLEDLHHGPWLVNHREIVNLETGHEIAVPRANIPPANVEWDDLHFSPDGRTFAFSNATHKDGIASWCIEWHDVEKGRLLRQFKNFKGQYVRQINRVYRTLRWRAPKINLNFTFSADGEKLVVVADNGIDFLPLDGSTPDFFQVPESTDGSALSSDGKLFFTGDQKPDFRYEWKFYDLSRRWLRFKSEMENPLANYILSPDGSYIFISDCDTLSGGTWVTDAKTGRKVRDIPFPNLQDTVYFSPDSQMLIVSGGDGLKQLQATRTGKLIRRLPAFLTNTGSQCAFSSEGNFLYGLDGFNGQLWKVRVR